MAGACLPIIRSAEKAMTDDHGGVMYEVDWGAVAVIATIAGVVALTVSIGWYGVAVGIMFFFWMSKQP